MRRGSGQAGRRLAASLHLLLHIAELVGAMVVVALALLAWRLSQGPLELPWLTHRLEAAMSEQYAPARITVGSAALAWEGFRMGVDRPLDVRMTDLAATAPNGARIMSIPRAEVSLAVSGLLLGRLQPRAVEFDQPRLVVRRAADGAVTLDTGAPEPQSTAHEPGPPNPLQTLLGELARPPTNDRGAPRAARLSQLRRVRIHDAALTVIDQQLGATWQAPHAEIDLRRLVQGGVEGHADIELALGEQTARLNALANLAAGGTETKIEARLSPVPLAALAHATPKLSGLAALDAPLGGEATLTLGRHLALRAVRFDAEIGAGHVHLVNSDVPLAHASIAGDATADDVRLRSAKVALIGHEGATPSIITAEGELHRDQDHLRSSLSLGLDQVAFADLPVLWPKGTGGGARPWIVQNITTGIAHDGHFDVTLEADRDFDSVALTSAKGTLKGDGLTVWWLRPVPPIDNASAELRVLDPDTLEIVVGGGYQQKERQANAGDNGALVIRRGSVRVTGIMQPHQIGDIDAEIGGPVAEAVALLREPRLRLLSKHPIELNSPSGQATAKLTLKVPLEDKVSMDDIPIHVLARLDRLQLRGVVAGRDLDQGAIDLDVNNDGLNAHGQALLAGIQSQIGAQMDFRAGPPSQVLQKVTVKGTVDEKQLAAAGLDAGPLLAGSAGVQAAMTERRNGQGEVQVSADLTDATLSAAPLGWRKPAGSPASGDLHLKLLHDRLVAVDRISLRGSELAVEGAADYAGNRPSTLTLDRIVLGRSEAHGVVHFPATASAAPIRATVNGPRLDLSAKFAETASPKPAAQPSEPGPPWIVDAGFDQATMGEGRVVSGLSVHAENDGRVLSRLRLEGRTGPAAPFHLDITPDRGGRKLTASASDAGSLLRALDIVGTMQGGHLSVNGNYDDQQADRPLSGTAEISDFRMRNAPAMARLLQAMTLYGLVGMAQGPGLPFTRLIAPFRLTDEAIELHEARAFSSSLGVTAKGRFDRVRNVADIEGTIVPAYFFNSLLGHIPFVGRLFSPERGGGVFAASFTVRGPLDDPQVSVNPLTALTPGFLRGLFGNL